MLALVDCNSCYASCEQIFQPDLRGKPVVVLSNNDGVIVTRNKEAKALGIPDLQPYFKIKDLLQKHNVTVRSSNYELYGSVSTNIMTLLETFGNSIEVYSIDEAFLDVTGFNNLITHGHDIKNACWKQQRMPVCVGIARTKTLAKLANHLAKKSDRLNGVCLIDDIESWNKVFSKIDTGKVWGIGSRISKQMKLMKINTILDLKQQSPKSMRDRFGVAVERTVNELNGTPCLKLESQPPPKQQIFSSRSFSNKITTLHELNESIANYAARAAEKLRGQNSFTKRIYVMIQSSRHASTAYNNSQSVPLLYPTNDSRLIIKAAQKLGTRLFKDGIDYAKAGVGLMELSNRGIKQADLFTPQQSVQSELTMNTFDGINIRYGKGTVFIGSQGIQRQWTMARSMKSPAYTTRFSDIPVIKL
ncbi:translesion error-prone DNA polymerase V subunit UmuC [Dasania marina]|uniref:translesion error-prone DNA polymerase V subunit UmuC n=1 Tax=Dasania marina TaxID=471499 RepID=UPI0003738849|nr:translesion error-prone DNA polymerase V subunit UmuC [Dasania marina]